MKYKQEPVICHGGETVLWLSPRRPHEVLMVYTSCSSITPRPAAANTVEEVPRNRTSTFHTESAELWSCKPGLLAELSSPEN